MIVANIYCVAALLVASILAVNALPPFPGAQRGQVQLNKGRFNGSSWFSETVIMISIDGMRSDYIDIHPAPTLLQMAKDGVRADYMTPSFPSTTFANHYTLATGLYPENHGIISNSFYDPTSKDTFDYKDLENIKNPKWWGGEPIWTTVAKGNKRSAVHMLPGSSVTGNTFGPTYLDLYRNGVALPQKADRILEWLDMADDKRPQFIGLYVSDVDTQGHNFGPTSNEVKVAMANVDNMMKRLFDGLRARHLDNIVNVLVVSDHGMKDVGPPSAILLDKIIDPKLIASNHGYPIAMLTPHNMQHVEPIYLKLKKAADATQKFDVYLKKDVPPEYHFSSSPRISPIICVPRSGYVMTTTQDIGYIGKGTHGYRNTDVEMRASFLARGPAIRNSNGVKTPGFLNVNLYNLMAHLLKVQPARNDGTINWSQPNAILKQQDSFVRL
ncbi:alkaline-phosphatase-like protein [Syncephalis plumigaleata]|nr:alkaline-phosphatase-like protein [Syncephalis plumigaleata]